MSNCKCCKTALTEMKNAEGEVICQRCLKCHPVTAFVEPEKKEDKYVDKPWTDERVIELIDKVVPDMIREAIIKFSLQETVIDEFIPEVEMTEDKPIKWQDEAKAMGIELYDKENKRPRKKVDVLSDIEKLKAPQPVDNI